VLADPVKLIAGSVLEAPTYVPTKEELPPRVTVVSMVVGESKVSIVGTEISIVLGST